jgi:hypothetical protein
MARFYARFDSGSESVLNSAYFDRRRVSTGAEAGADLRAGLIASRSALSLDVYDDLDSVNRDGQRGTNFPPDLMTTPNNPFSATAYTSSFDGIKIPTSNAYGTGTINYSKRPTGSVISSMTNIIGPTDPLDTVSVSYTTYTAASAAVKAVLDSVQRGSTVAQTPYTRPGLTPSRTLHSIWHDPDLQYFAWDDFTPGTLPKPVVTAFGTGVGQVAVLDVSWQTPEYTNDKNPAAPLFLQISIAPTNDEPAEADRGKCTQTLTILSGSVTLGTDASGTGPTNCVGGGNTSWTWSGAGVLTWAIDTGGGEHAHTGYFGVYDPIIQTHSSVSPSADVVEWNPGGLPANNPPPPPPPPDYCDNYLCSSVQYEANHPDCGGSCPNCNVGVCVDY